VPRFQNFLGPTYRAASVNIDAEVCTNLYMEKTESPSGSAPFPYALLGTPGLISRVAGMHGPIRGLWSQDGRTFAVGRQTLYELSINYTGNITATSLANMAVDDNPVSMVSNGHGGHQLLIVSAGFGYIYDLASGVFQQISDPSFPLNALMADFLDGFFIILQATTSNFSLSDEFDGLTWNGDSGQVQASSDNTVAIRVIQRTLWLIGTQRTEVWVNTGGSFPLQPIAGVLIEHGTPAPWSVSECDGSICMIGQDAQGTAMVLQSEGYAFRRISTHAEERELSLITDLSSARAYSYQEHGHAFYVIRLNTGAAMVYDLAERQWHRRGVWNTGTNAFDPPLQATHCFGLNRHLVGDATSGTVYEQTLAAYTDAGTPIRRVRACPHINEDAQWIFYSQFQLECETGVGTVATPTPTLWLRYSSDGGHTFSSPRAASMGIGGAYRARAIWRRLGRARDRVFEVSGSDPVPHRFLAAYLKATPGGGQS
jgi:hypothetical protein